MPLRHDIPVLEGTVVERTGKGRSMTIRLLACLIVTWACSVQAADHVENRTEYAAPFAAVAPTVDGIDDEFVWSQATWHAIDSLWLGEDFAGDEFAGRFKVAWNEDSVFVLVEIVDDVLYDGHRPPLVQYWDDDCLEIFVDEDHSGGDHQYNHNAFAYHVSLDNQVVDIGTDRVARLYNHHIESRWQAVGNKLVWELAIDIYADDYVDDSNSNQPVVLVAGKRLGLMLAWCDNDGSEIRERFIGSETVPTGPKDRGWIDAGLFGTLNLKGKEQ